MIPKLCEAPDLLGVPLGTMFSDLEKAGCRPPCRPPYFPAENHAEERPVGDSILTKHMTDSNFRREISEISLNQIHLLGAWYSDPCVHVGAACPPLRFECFGSKIRGQAIGRHIVVTNKT